MEEAEAERRAFTQGVALRLRDEAARDGLFFELLGRHAPSVVGDADEDVGLLAACRQPDVAGPWLARFGAFVGGLQAVIDGIADEVQQRVAEDFEHRVVEHDLIAVDRKIELAAPGARQIACGARDRPHDRGERHQAGGEHLVVQRARVDVQRVETLEHLQQSPVVGVRLGCLRRQRPHPRDRDEEVAHRIEHGVEERCLDAQRA